MHWGEGCGQCWQLSFRLLIEARPVQQNYDPLLSQFRLPYCLQEMQDRGEPPYPRICPIIIFDAQFLRGTRATDPFSKPLPNKLKPHLRHIRAVARFADRMAHLRTRLLGWLSVIVHVQVSKVALRCFKHFRLGILPLILTVLNRDYCTPPPPPPV